MFVGSFYKHLVKSNNNLRKTTKNYNADHLSRPLPTLRKAGQIGARQLANVAYGAAQSGRGELLGLLRSALARAAEFGSH